MEYLGFGAKLIGWVKNILFSASTTVLLNRVLENSINAKEDSEQVVPISSAICSRWRAFTICG
jgi:hypothetical protein